MNEILLYLTLKYSGEWLAVYNSLKNREKITRNDWLEVKNKINCEYTSMLDEDYPEGLKTVYKPPFGIFWYGNYKLINNKPVVTVFTKDINESNKPYLDEITKNGGKLLWVDLSNKDMLHVLKQYPKDNLFWLPEIKTDSNRTLFHLLENEDIKNNNLFFSELWIKNKTTDYSQQADERLYLGISHKVLVLEKLDSKQLLALASYGSMEDIKFVFKKELFDEKLRKLFTKCKVWLIDDIKEIYDYFFDEK